MAEVELVVIDIDLLLGGVAHPVEDDLTKVREVDQVVPVSVGFPLKCIIITCLQSTAFKPLEYQV